MLGSFGSWIRETEKLDDKNGMPDVPQPDFRDALAEIRFQINFVAYHMACGRVYSQSDALRTKTVVLRDQEQLVRDHVQLDVVVSCTHLAAFFWHLERSNRLYSISAAIIQTLIPCLTQWGWRRCGRVDLCLEVSHDPLPSLCWIVARSKGAVDQQRHG